MKIDAGAAKKAITVLQSAIGQDEHGNYVMTVNGDGVVEQHRVALGEAIGSRQVVTSGIKVGDKVIVQGLQKAADGKKVRAENIKVEE